jgi:hypothetical protein
MLLFFLFILKKCLFIKYKYIYLYQQTKTKIMKANYFYYGQPITKKEFLKNVPENWEDEIIDFEYSWGGYRASIFD